MSRGTLVVVVAAESLGMDGSNQNEVSEYARERSEASPQSPPPDSSNFIPA